MMLMQQGKIQEGCEEFMFHGQNEMQFAFVIISLACVPVLLLGKPLYLIFKSSMNGKNVRKDTS